RESSRDIRGLYRVSDGSGLSRHPMDTGPDRARRLLLLAGAERDVPESVHIGVVGRRLQAAAVRRTKSVTTGRLGRKRLANEATVYRITLSPVGHSVTCGPEDTVLTAILQSGASVMFGCRGGGCGTCKMRLHSGRVDHGRCSAAVLPEEEKEHGWFLSCQARPLSELTIELTPANKYRAVMSWGELK